MPENIKTKINVHWEDENSPFYSAEDYEELKRAFYITEDSGDETTIREIEIEGEMHEIVDYRISIAKETREDHMQYGIDMALVGEPLPYNFRVSIYLRR